MQSQGMNEDATQVYSDQGSAHKTNTQTLTEALAWLTKSMWMLVGVCALPAAKCVLKAWSKRPLLETIGLKCCCLWARGLRGLLTLFFFLLPSSFWISLLCLSSHLSRAISSLAFQQSLQRLFHHSSSGSTICSSEHKRTHTYMTLWCPWFRRSVFQSH